MSTLSGNASKGEKAKPSKFSVLDINHLYKSKGNESEVTQNKNAVPRKAGMQKLGNLPLARRPTNLPSLKSENSNNQISSSETPTVNSSSVQNNASSAISGGARWASKPGENQTTTPTSNASATQDLQMNTIVAGTLQQPLHASPFHPMQGIHPIGMVGAHNQSSKQNLYPDMKTWQMKTYGEMSASAAPSFLAHQSPLFQHEFPSLSSSSNDNTTSTSTPSSTTSKNTSTDTQYGPGPSLRPQTEGSWIQGGSCPQNMMGHTPGSNSATVLAQGPLMNSSSQSGLDGGRNNLGPSGAGVVPVGPYTPALFPPHMLPPQFRGVMPPFMLRNAYPGGFPTNFATPPYPPPPYGTPERFMSPPPPLPQTQQPPPKAESPLDEPSRSPTASPKKSDSEDSTRSASATKKEDDASKNNSNQISAEPAGKFSWAESVEIEYSQKSSENEDVKNISLSVGRSLSSQKDNNNLKNNWGTSKVHIVSRDRSRDSDYQWHLSRQQPLPSSTDFKSHIAPRFQNSSNRFSEEDDRLDNSSRRRPKTVESDAVLRARQRKEEEEKRYIESKEAAAKKLKMLEEKLGVLTVHDVHDKGSSENMKIPLPTWEKDKKTASDESVADDEKRKTSSSSNFAPIPVAKDASEFRELTQFVDCFAKNKEKDRGTTRHFGAEIPPRFQRQQSSNAAVAQSKQTPLSQPSATNVGNVLQISSDNRRVNSSSYGSSQYSSAGGITSNSMGSIRHERKDSERSADSGNNESRILQDEDHRPRQKDYHTPLLQNNNDYNLDNKDRYSKNKFEYRDEDEYNRNRDGEFYDRNRDNKRDFHQEGHKEQETDYKRPQEWEQHSNKRTVSGNWEQQHDVKHNVVSNETTRDRIRRNSPEQRRDEWESATENTKISTNYYDKSEKGGRDRDYDLKPLEKSNENINRRKEENNKQRATDKERDSYNDRKDHHHKEEKWNNSKEQGDDYELSKSGGGDYGRKDYDYDCKKLNDMDRRSPSQRDTQDQRRTPRRDSRESRDPYQDDMSYMYDDSKSQWVEETEMTTKSHLRKENNLFRGADGHDNRREKDYYGYQPSRHIPGPITRDRLLESSKCEQESKANLTQLVRSTDKRNLKKQDANRVSEKTKSGIENKKRAVYDKGRMEEIGEKGRNATDSRDKGTSQFTDSRDKGIPQFNQVLMKDLSSPLATTSTISKSDSKEQFNKEPTHEGEKECSSTANNNNWEVEDGGDQLSRSDDRRSDRRSNKQQSDRSNKKSMTTSGLSSRWSQNRNHNVYMGRGGYSAPIRGSSRFRNKWVAPTRGSRRGDGSVAGGSDWGKYSDSEYSYDDKSTGPPAKDGRTEKEKPSSRAPKQSSRKSERDDRNRDYWPVDEEDYYYPSPTSSNSSRKYESGRNTREHAGGSGYYEPARRGRGTFRSNSNISIGSRMDGYGPPPTKSPFTKKEEQQSDEQKSQTQNEKKNDASQIDSVVEKDKESVIAEQSSKHDQKSNISTVNKQHLSDNERYAYGGGGSRNAPRKSDGDRNWKNRPQRANSGTTRSRQVYPSTYKKPQMVASGQTTDQMAEYEDTWETASEGEDVSAQEMDGGGKHSSVAGGGRQNVRNAGSRRTETGQSAKRSPRKIDNTRSISRKRSYDRRRSGPSYGGSSSKRETQKYYTVGKRFPDSNHESLSRDDDYNENDTGKDKTRKDGATNSKKPSEKNDSSRYSQYDSQSRKNYTRGMDKQRPDGSNRYGKSVSSNKNGNNYNTSRSGPSPRLQREKSNSDYQQQQTDTSASSIPPVKEVGPPRPAPPPTVNAWDKPITASFRSQSPSVKLETDPNVGLSTENVITERESVENKTKLHSSAGELAGSAKKPDKALLDGNTPPTQTIIFENTNFRSVCSSDLSSNKAVGSFKNSQFDNVGNDNSQEMPAYISAADLQSSARLAMPMDYPFHNAEDCNDMKLDFSFDSTEFSMNDDDKSSEKGLGGLSQAIQIVQTATAADLNFKIASVKRVWDEGTIIEFEDGSLSSFTTSSMPFCKPPTESAGDNDCYCPNETRVDSMGHVQMDAGAKVYSPVVSPIQVVNSSYGNNSNIQQQQQSVVKGDSNLSSSNVCKVKPQRQGVGNAVVMLSSSAAPLLGTLSPPPTSYTYTSSTQQAIAGSTAQINFQPTGQYNNMGPIPSPPAILYSSQQLGPPTSGAPPTAGLYQTYQIDGGPQIISNQRPQYAQFPTYSGLAPTTAFNQQNVFVQPPPTAAAPPDVYSQQYRMQPPPSYGTSALNSTPPPNTVLISNSTNNSLLSSSVKPPPSTQMAAIGTKSQYTNQPQQLYIPCEAPTQMLNQSYLQAPGSQLLPQRQVQSSFFSTATPTVPGQAGYYPTNAPANSTLQGQTAAPYGITAFNPATPAPIQNMQNFNSQLAAQQFRNQFVKSTNALTHADMVGNPKTILANPRDIFTFPPGGPPIQPPVKPRLQQQTSGKTVIQTSPPQQLTQAHIQHGGFAFQTNQGLPRVSQPQHLGNNNGSGNLHQQNRMQPQQQQQYPMPIQRPPGLYHQQHQRTGNSNPNMSARNTRSPHGRNTNSHHQQPQQHPINNNNSNQSYYTSLTSTGGYNMCQSPSKLELSDVKPNNETADLTDRKSPSAPLPETLDAESTPDS